MEQFTSSKEITPLFTGKKPMHVAVFMSGTGSIARKILEHARRHNEYQVTMLFSDTKDREKCRAGEIAGEYKVAYECIDILDFYASHGKSDKSDLTLRPEYDRAVRKILEKYSIDLIALAGYMSLLTRAVYGHYPVLNIHPADLRVMENGRREYAGPGGMVMRRVIKDGQKETRSSVLLVNGEVDGGPLLAVSRPAPVSFDAEGLTKQQLAERVMEHWNNVHKPICEWAFFPEVISM